MHDFVCTCCCGFSLLATHTSLPVKGDLPLDRAARNHLQTATATALDGLPVRPGVAEDWGPGWFPTSRRFKVEAGGSGPQAFDLCLRHNPTMASWDLTRASKADVLAVANKLFAEKTTGHFFIRNTRCVMVKEIGMGVWVLQLPARLLLHGMAWSLTAASVASS